MCFTRLRRGTSAKLIQFGSVAIGSIVDVATKWSAFPGLAVSLGAINSGGKQPLFIAASLAGVTLLALHESGGNCRFRGDCWCCGSD